MLGAVLPAEHVKMKDAVLNLKTSPSSGRKTKQKQSRVCVFKNTSRMGAMP